jgi:hypothetical protein
MSFYGNIRSQYIYYKEVTPKVVSAFKDSADKILIFRKDTMLRHQFAYVLKFFPGMPLDYMMVDFRDSKHIANTRPTFFSIFKAPAKRTYKISLSSGTGSTIDSAIFQNLSFNAQIGLIANQVSMVEDLSAGGFFNFLSFYTQRLSAKGKNRLYRLAEEKTIDVGLGHQLLAYNIDFIEKLKIEKWLSTIGYATYARFYRNRPMKIELIRTFINDLPVYIQHQYK